ncbi:MAG: carbohydrate-binding protein [Roseivirga sp.]|nr:carbohydrate-binding protein [Roseivirga sp.]
MIINPVAVLSQTTTVGSGSYTNTFPGVDEAGRNSFPSGTPQLSGNALGKPVPTNDWWSYLIKEDHVSNLFNYPMAMKTVNSGLVVSYIPWGVFDDQEPVIVGVTGLNASRATVSDYSDWTVSMNWDDGSHQIEVTAGIAMPFLYFNKASDDEVSIKVNLGDVTISDEMLIIENARNDGDFVFYAPSGSTWTQSGDTYTSDLNGKDYWSMAMIPLTATSISTVAEEYKKYAYVFPANTTTSWAYDESTGKVKTDFVVETDIKEGVETNVLMGLLPHQWDNLAAGSPEPQQYSYSSVRGEIKTMAGNTFSVENTFSGILPTMPYLANYSDGFSPAEMEAKITQLENDQLATWTDSYNEGQVMNRLIQTARIADQTGNIEARDKMIATIKERLEDWLTVESSEVAFLFYYNSDWSAMLGYPAGHGQDGNINDHHFHWGYFIHAAAFMEQFEPGWADEWGEMINHLVRDAASANRNDELFPFLRNFSPYAGHCWANGFATFPNGNDQESTSESMQFNSSLIHWGTITGNDEIRDLGIYLYTTEQTAIEEYWFDMNERNFRDDQQYGMVSRVWGNSYDNGTFWTSDITASYVIEMYPIHGGSLYLGQNQDYVQKIWDELKVNTGILGNDDNPNLWHDVIWKYLSFIDPAEAIALYNAKQERTLKFGVSDAQTYHWLHSINAMGTVKNELTADYPIAAAFEKDGKVTYVAHNYSNAPITVTFSDGYQLSVPAMQMATSRDISVNAVLTSDFDRAYANGSVNLSATIDGEGVTKVEFIDGTTLIGEKTQAPFEMQATDLSLGIHGLYARVYVDEEFKVTNTVSVQVGEQVPFLGTPFDIPGTIEAGHYDKFEGGNGQGISYSDVSANNEGDYRTDEGADVAFITAEGATLGWISGGEWVEYTVNVKDPGLYDMSFRYASDNQNGGGPFQLELDGQVISDPIAVASTDGWNNWETLTVSDLPFAGGDHILRLVFENGEFNLGKMTFELKGDLPYSQPVADAGANIVVVTPDSQTSLDGSGSSDPANGDLSYTWTQIFGPGAVTYSDNTVVSPQISGLVEGVYLFELAVSNGDYSDKDELYVIVSESTNIVPFVSIVSPVANAEFFEGKPFNINATASDLDGTVTQVEFFVENNSIGTDTEEPFSMEWAGEIGNYSLTAVATDNGGNTATSQSVAIEVKEAPSCEGVSTNGDFNYLFSDDAENPTITFIPNETGVGSPTCILYYATSQGQAFPGYNVTPNVPFALNAEAGSTVYFYYTYSYPGLGDKTTIEDVLSYQVGTCRAEEVPAMLEMANATLNVDENSAAGTVVGSISAAYTGTESLNYSIKDGNAAGAFLLNAANGQLMVADAGPLDYEMTTSFTLSIEVTDGTLTANATLTVEVNDVNDTATLEMVDASMSIDENSADGTVVGTVSATYTGDGTLSYSITNGNSSGAFALNAGTGVLTVADENQLDFETATSFTVNLQVTDGTLTDDATLIVNINDVDEIVTGFEDVLPPGLKVYPNPVSTTLSLSFSYTDRITVHHVMDAQGRKQQIPVTSENTLMVFDFSKVSNGMYLILMENHGKRYYLKVLKSE